MKQPILILLAFFLSFASIAQTSENQKNTWTLLEDKEGVKFYVSFQEVELTKGFKPYSVMYVKVENTLEKEVSISFSLAAFFKEGCAGCVEPESIVQLVIPANESLEGSQELNKSGMQRVIFNPNVANNFEFQSAGISTYQRIR